MAYYLTVEKGRKNGKNVYEKLDITKSPCFTRQSKTLKGIGCSLGEIDAFTTQFYDEKELREHLLNNGIISFECIDRTLTLRQVRNGKLEKVRHDFLYQKDIEYIFDPTKLISRIKEKLYNHDFRFIEKFANNYSSFRDCASTAPDVRNAAKESIRIAGVSRLFNEIDENGDDLLSRMVKLLIYEYYQGEDGKVCYRRNQDGNIIRKHRNLHSIIAFVNNYDEEHNRNLISEDISALTQQVSTTDTSEFRKRTRRKKNEPLDGQLKIDSF